MIINIETELIKYLNQELKDIKTYADIPSKRPSEFITVEKTAGGDIERVIDDCMVAVQCWSTSRYKASELAIRVDEILSTCAFYIPHVMKAKRNTMYNFPDLETEQPRYQIVYEFKTFKEN